MQLFQDLLRDRTSDEWLAIFAKEGVNASRMGVIEELMHDEQVLRNGYVVPPVDADMEMPHVVNHPLHLEGVARVGPKRAPELGEHSTEVLESLGYTHEQIQSLREQGVI